MSSTRRRGEWNAALMREFREKGLAMTKAKAPLWDKQAVADEAFSDIMEYLALSRVDLALVPFLENRTEKLANTKKQIDVLEKEIISPRLKGRMDVLYKLDHIKPAAKEAARKKLAVKTSAALLSPAETERPTFIDAPLAKTIRDLSGIYT